MVERVKQWLEEGKTVKLFTARITGSKEDTLAFLAAWVEWWTTHVSVEFDPLPVTATKDFEMYVLYDDRAVQVRGNLGTLVG